MESFLNFELLESFDAEAFRSKKPFPWLNPRDMVLPEAWAVLERDLPRVEDFEKRFGEERPGGQVPHDRFSLEYRPGLPIAESWERFIGELRSDRHRSAMARLFDVKTVEFRFHWHYTPASCSVSPHVDGAREYGSHIFYFNPPDWNPDWGGQTLILDDGGRLPRDAAPEIEDFDQVIPAECDAGRSLLFLGRGHGWHGVRALHCPDDFLRRVFIMVINPVSIYWKVRDRLIGKSIQRL